ncbi:short-chain dehydrogenase/reductase (SDR) family protein [Tieghemostelium lacteum]|uniref:Short-chain dehydrogenase/reductase (SDR) family protein n=1 Tax=Tieghemostelium lacteum TaxID=361077 RepID=A0A151Z466_TIELA|nr:short-chain dehydrogenase/reductase (SDR) family protein [Tieghemostelium lacteum]|eukprot:KYQ88735.1 short-chain dehydrogenase/reductase (SDR) family protein [Tieghemostelium lacteum]
MEPIVNNNKKVVIFTGATDGIGRETINVLAQERGLKLILTARNIEKGNKVAEELNRDYKAKNDELEVSVMKMDMASLESIKEFVRDFKALNIPLDTLVCNAGVMPSTYQTTKEGYEHTFGINHLGTFLLTYSLVDKLNQSTFGGNIVIVASRMHYKITKLDMDHLQSNEKTFSYQNDYSRSKLCNVLFAKELDKKLRARGSNVKVNSLHPGFAVTSLIREWGYFAQKVVGAMAFVFGNKLEDMAEGMASLTLNKANETGKYYQLKRIEEPSKLSRKEGLSEQLWNKSCELLALPQELTL